jgi:hypothetical protein
LSAPVPIVAKELEVDEDESCAEPILPDETVQYVNGLPYTVWQFLQSHAEGCFLADLAKLIRIKKPNYLVYTNKIIGVKVLDPHRRGTCGGHWFVQADEALRISTAVCCWVSYSTAVVELKKLGLRVSDNCLRNYMNRDILKVAKGEDIFGRSAVMREDLPEIAKIMPELKKKRRQKAGQRNWLQKEGELSSEQAHELLIEITYKKLLTMFGRKMLHAKRKSGHWFTSRPAIDQFLDEVANGEHRKKYWSTGLQPQTVRSLLAARERLACQLHSDKSSE